MRNVSAMPEVGGRLSAMRSIELSIRGMTCAACAARIEKKLNVLDQDVVAAVSFATEKATITAAETVSAQALVAAVEGAGYAAEVALPAAEGEPEAGNQAGYLRRRLILALVSFVPLSGWSAYAMFHLDRGPGANALQELAHASGGPQDDQAQSGLGVRLQRRGRAASRPGLPQPAHRRRRDDDVLGPGGSQQPATAFRARLGSRPAPSVPLLSGTPTLRGTGSERT